MPLLISITIGLLMAVTVYLMLSHELKAVAMGIFLLGHAANLSIIAVSRSPLEKRPPVLGEHGAMLANHVDPLPQALILTAIVIGFALQAFLLVLLVVTSRRTRTLELSELAAPPAPLALPHKGPGPPLRRRTVEDLTIQPDATGSR